MTPNALPTIRAEGALFPPDLLQRIAAADRDLGGLQPVDYGLPAGERLGEAISRAWNRARAYWQAFQAARTAPGGDAASSTTRTREQWLFPLLEELGYPRPEFQAAAEEMGGRRYPISHRSGGVPLHLLSYEQRLDTAVAGGGARLTPHALLQEYLNRSDLALYGVVSNGLHLRLLRDNQSLTRLAYVDFDLEAMFEGGVYADFALLFLLVHRTRLPQPGKGGEASGCWLEQWREKAESGGIRALGALRAGVVEAIQALGNGLLAHPENRALRAALADGSLTTAGFYQELLRLVYRLIFLFVAEERDLLHPTDARPEMKRRYLEHYSLTRLRQIARRARTERQHDDLWYTLRVTFRLLSGEQAGFDLLPLDGLFAPDACPHLADAPIRNDALASALLHLTSVRVDRRVRRVSYRDMGAEELGGVYEGLLEQQPAVDLLAAPGKQFSLVGSGQRKSSGSYYTPDSLVQEVLKQALDPVIAACGQTEAELLALKVVDSACGSGHFLVGAARRLGAELARLRAGDREPDLAERRAAVRDVVRHCTYGVDLNPLAVDLCRLGLWLESAEPGKPLSFLDHHVKVGNALVGATPDLVDGGLPDEAFEPVADDDRDLAKRFKQRNRQERPKVGRNGRRAAETQAAYLTGVGELLVDWPSVADRLARGAEAVEQAAYRGETADDVQAARAAYAQYRAAEVDPVRERLDAWTAAFFWPLKGGPSPGSVPPPTTADLRPDRQGRPVGLSDAQRAEVRRLRDAVRFFHWPLEFPEVFEPGRERGGFDCVLGNPPWERIKLQEQEFFAARDPAIATAPNKAARDRLIQALPTTPAGAALHAEFVTAKRAAEGASLFVRESGRFPLTAVGDVNLYPLFAEHNRGILNGHGRAGVIVPTGIATDDSTKAFFQDVVERGSLASLFDFENRQALFPDVDSRMKFCVLALAGGRVARGDLAFFLTSTAQLADERRRFQLSAEDFALLNPNTRTCPVFRTRADADLTRAIYARVPVLVDERRGLNPWGVEFQRMFDMSNDSHLFRDAPAPGLVPLYEAKLFHQFTHRWATYTNDNSRDSRESELADVNWLSRPRYWVEANEVRSRIEDRWPRKWLLASRMIAPATNERTWIAAICPQVAMGNSGGVWILKKDLQPEHVGALLGNVNALVTDYVVKQKVGGSNLNFFLVKQFPVLPPSAYTEADLAFVVPRVLELSYTAWDLRPFARDLGYDGPPYRWDEQRRALLRAELDATYASLYGLTRDELRYVLDPHDVYGPDFPGETFRVLKERELRQYGEYRTRRLVLEAWDRLGLEPRNRDGRYDAGTPATPTSTPAPSRPLTPTIAAPRQDGTTASTPAESPLLAMPQTVRERQRTPARVADLFGTPPAVAPARQGAPPPPVLRTETVRPSAALPTAPSNDGAATPPTPPQQPTLPGLPATPAPQPTADGQPDATLRQRILQLALAAIRQRAPIKTRDLLPHVERAEPRATRPLLNSVLYHEGAPHLLYDEQTGLYRPRP